MKTQRKPRQPFSWPAARPLVAAEMERQQLKRVDIAERAGLPRMTVYHAMGESAQIYADTLDRMLAALGRDLAWLLKEIKGAK